MNPVTPILAIAAVLAIGALAGLVMLIIGMRTEGNRMSPNGAPHSRTSIATRRVLGVYVRRAGDTTVHDPRR